MSRPDATTWSRAKLRCLLFAQMTEPPGGEWLAAEGRPLPVDLEPRGDLGE